MHCNRAPHRATHLPVHPSPQTPRAHIHTGCSWGRMWQRLGCHRSTWTPHGWRSRSTHLGCRDGFPPAGSELLEPSVSSAGQGTGKEGHVSTDCTHAPSSTREGSLPRAAAGKTAATRAIPHHRVPPSHHTCMGFARPAPLYKCPSLTVASPPSRHTGARPSPQTYPHTHAHTPPHGPTSTHTCIDAHPAKQTPTTFTNMHTLKQRHTIPYAPPPHTHKHTRQPAHTLTN
jgi:hypothetical protein